MALVPLVPWVYGAAAYLAQDAGCTVGQAERLGPVAAALVSQYVGAADVPQAILDEAVIRAVGWLAGASGSVFSSKRIGDLTITTDGRRVRAGALRGSGAAALLAPWRRNYGGICG